MSHDDRWRIVIETILSGEPDTDRQVLDRVSAAVGELNWPAAHLERLMRALNNATRTVVGRRHSHDTAMPLVLRVLVAEPSRAPSAADSTTRAPSQDRTLGSEAQTRNRTPAGAWGFFLVERTQDGAADATHQLIELFLYREGERVK
jgi:hypothetical protein